MRQFFAILVAAALAACAANNADILNVQNAPIGANAQQADAGPIIEQALAGRGWQVAARRPGAIDAFILVRTHRADISITYDRTSYSIAYRDSQNLEYREGRIHRNYNRWIANLHGDIQQLMAGAPRA